MHDLIIRLTPDQAEAALDVVVIVIVLAFVGFAAVVYLSRKVRELEVANADLRRRLLTAQTVGQTQAQALETVDAMARATRRWS